MTILVTQKHNSWWLRYYAEDHRCWVWGELDIYEVYSIYIYCYAYGNSPACRLPLGLAPIIARLTLALRPSIMGLGSLQARSAAGLSPMITWRSTQPEWHRFINHEAHSFIHFRDLFFFLFYVCCCFAVFKKKIIETRHFLFITKKKPSYILYPLRILYSLCTTIRP